MKTLQIIFTIATLIAIAGCDAPPTGSNSTTDSGMTSGTDAGPRPDTARSDTATTEDSGLADTGDPPDSAPPPIGDPIEAPAETWSWVDFPDSVCGNGEPTGIGVNLTDRSDDVLVFFLGGGACWDVNSCFVLNAAVNIESGYVQANFEADRLLDADAFDRDLADNPFRDMSFVYVPYCTGDLHAGDKVTTYMALGQTREVHHRGGHNVEQFLARLAPTFADAGRIYVSGSSAGGYGAQLNFHRFADTFPDAEVHVLSDSGPLLQPSGGRFGEMNAAWTLQTPPGCDDCGDGFPQWFDYLVDTYPESRFGLLNYEADQTIHLYFNYPVGDSFKNALAAFVDDHYGAPNTRPYVLAGTQHVLLGGLMSLQSPAGVTLRDWTEAWVEGSDDWQSVRP